MDLRHLATLGSVATLALVTACAPMRREERVVSAPVPAAGYSNYAQAGQVVDIQVIQSSQRTSGGGAVLGAVLGGVIGNQFGKGGGRALATGAGAIGGAVAGNAIESNRNRNENEVYRVSVRFDDGSTRAIDFQRVDDLRVGDRVRWQDGQLYRM